MMSALLFTYGTLMIPEIIQSIIGRSLSGETAWLKDYRRGRLLNASYPGIIKCTGTMVEGILYHDIGFADLDRLSQYEGEQYDLALVKVKMQSAMQTQAYTYVLNRQFINLLTDQDWSLDEFEKDHKEAFTASYAGFNRVNK